MKTDNSLKKLILIITLFITLLTIIIMVGYNNFSQYKNTVITQQQEHLLTIVKSISRSINQFIDYKINSLSILARDPSIIESLRTDNMGRDYDKHKEVLEIFLQTYSDDIEKVVLFDDKGKMIYKYENHDSIKDIVVYDDLITRVIKSKKGFISKEYLSGPNQFSIDIFEPIFNNDNEISGILLNTINLNKLYKNLIYPIRPGKKGYAMVKNMDGFIVMHSVTDQIGIESIKVRKELFPEYDWTGLEELNRKQIEEGEGYHIYSSRWWQDEGKGLTQKINAYTTIKIGDIAWIISVQMDYLEIEQPIKGSLINMAVIAFVIIILLMGGLYMFLKMDKKRKELEMEARYLKELNNAWEELIKSEARLRHSQKLETIGTLTNGISHEFNNLLSPILGYSEILLQSIDVSNTIYEDILEINRSALRLKEIIGQILSFSRDDGKVPKFQYLEINHILKESINLIKTILPYKLKIVDDINSYELILGNSTQLQQVLINLYTNSYHAMASEGGILEINTSDVYIRDQECEELSLLEGKYVKIQVKDNGVGMNSQTLEHIFDYYFTTKEPGIGTGLGLPVVHGIVENHKGRIFIKSELGIGTTVDIYLPGI